MKKDSIKLEDAVTRKLDIGNTKNNETSVRAYFILRYFLNTFFWMFLKGIYFLLQVQLIISTFLLLTSFSCHFGTYSSPKNLHKNLPPMSHAGLCGEEKTFLILLMSIPKLPVIINVVSIDVTTLLTASPLMNCYNKLQA